MNNKILNIVSELNFRGYSNRLKGTLEEIIRTYKLPFKMDDIELKIDIIEKKIKNNYSDGVNNYVENVRYNNITNNSPSMIKTKEEQIFEDELNEFIRPFVRISDFYKDDYYIKDIKNAFKKYFSQIEEEIYENKRAIYQIIENEKSINNDKEEISSNRAMFK